MTTPNMDAILVGVHKALLAAAPMCERPHTEYQRNPDLAILDDLALCAGFSLTLLFQPPPGINPPEFRTQFYASVLQRHEGGA